MEGVCQWNRSRNKCSNLLEKFKSYSNSRLNLNLGKVTNLVMEDGNTTTTNKLKAETFASSLGKNHQINYEPNHDLHTETEALMLTKWFISH